MEQPFVTAVTHSDDEARVTLTGVRDEPGVAGRIFTALAEANVNVDVIIQNEPVGDDELADLSFTVDRSDLTTATETIAGLGELSRGVRTDEQIGKVSIVGAGMRSHPGVAAKVFEVLGGEGINIEMISTSPIKISCVISADRVPDAVKALHEAFDLGSDAVRRRGQTAPLEPHGLGMTRRLQGRSAGRDRRGRPTILEVLAERGFPASEVVPFASERSAGKQIEWNGAPARGPAAERGVDPGPRPGPLLGRRRGQRRVGAAVRRGRGRRRRQHQLLAHARRRPAGRRRGQPGGARRPQGIVANPNCTAMQMLVALAPIHRAAGLERLILSSYQAVSGTGQRAVEELRDAVAGRPRRAKSPPPAVYPHQIAFNVLPQVETFKDGDDYTTEERKVMAETRKILELGEEVGISATCVRVPVVTGHSESINVQTREDLSPEECRELLARHPGVVVVDDPGAGPTRWRSTPPAETRSWSAASAATPGTSAASTSGSSATTCARGRRPTPSRSPSCSAEREPAGHRAEIGRMDIGFGDAAAAVRRAARGRRRALRADARHRALDLGALGRARDRPGRGRGGRRRRQPTPRSST